MAESLPLGRWTVNEGSGGAGRVCGERMVLIVLTKPHCVATSKDPCPSSCTGVLSGRKVIGVSNKPMILLVNLQAPR